MIDYIKCYTIIDLIRMSNIESSYIHTDYITSLCYRLGYIINELELSYIKEVL